MYKKFFSFRERPFKLVPNPEYYYLSRSHEEATAHLTYALAQGDGFVEITGEVGTGKTMLCRVFLENLDEQTEVAYIFNPKLDPLQLLRAINDEFGIDSTAADTKALIDTLNAYLMRKRTEGRRAMLLIDEAQNLARNVLEQLRLLSNLETSRYKLLQIILVGQPELADTLDSYELRQLGQRITLSCHLQPLSAGEVREYIEHRLHVAAVHDPNVTFTRGAYRSIWRFSRGIPRLINIVCDRCLLTAFSRETHRITGRIARSAIGELNSRKETPPPLGRLLQRPATLLALGCLAAAALVYAWQAPLGPTAIVRQFIETPAVPPKTAAPVVESAVHPSVVATSPDTAGSVGKPAAGADDLSEFLSDMEVRTARHLAAKAVLALWGRDSDIPSELDAIEDDYAFFRAAAEANGMAVIRLRCRAELLKTLNLPAIVTVRLPGEPATGFLTVRQIDGAGITLVRPGMNRTATVTPEAFKSRCAGALYVPYIDFMAYDGSIPRSVPHESVVVLKMFLQDVGFTNIDLNPYYDEFTERAVRHIQQKHGLPADGIVGPLTKIVLYNEKESLNIPHVVRDYPGS
jgi:general secretion pathway protein A